MASLVESLIEQLESRGAIDQIAARLGVPAGQANSAVSTAVPAILAGLARNTQRPEGAAELARALDKDHDGSALDDDSYFDSYQQRKGDKILGHVFGEKTPAVESQVSALGGLDTAKGSELMKMLAPLIMGYLGKQKSSGGFDIGSLSQILGGGGGGSGGLQLPGGLGDLLEGLGGGGGSTDARGAQPAGTAPRSPGLGSILGRLFRRK